MKAAFLLMAILVSTNAYAEGCVAYGRAYAEGEQDCDGRNCGKDGIWTGVVKSGVCDVTDEDAGRDPASVKKHKKAKHAKPKKKKSKPAKGAGSH